MTALGLGPAPARRALLVRRVRLLVVATITYNLVEAAVALTAGSLASSTALVGFGLDSLIEANRPSTADGRRGALSSHFNV